MRRFGFWVSVGWLLGCGGESNADSGDIGAGSSSASTASPGETTGAASTVSAGSSQSGEDADSTAGSAGSNGADSTGAGSMGTDSTGAEETTGSSGEPGVLSVVQFNVLHGFPDFAMLEQREQILVDWINAEKPDIIGVQETAQNGLMPNRGQVIADATGYEWEFEQASGIPGIFVEGPGVLSRWPITDREGLELPHVNGFEIRKALRVRIDTPWGEVDLTSTHLTTQDPQDIKADQALAAWGLTVDNRTAAASFFVGDMNATPDSLAMTAVRGEVVHNDQTGDAIDAWLAVNPDDPGLTASSDDPDRRIDYLYVVPGTRFAGEVLDCERIFVEPVDGLYASDHIGVHCHVRVLP